MTDNYFHRISRCNLLNCRTGEMRRNQKFTGKLFSALCQNGKRGKDIQLV